jgi:hypothetical protein
MLIRLAVIDTGGTPPGGSAGNSRNAHRRQRTADHGFGRGDETKLAWSCKVSGELKANDCNACKQQ